MSMTNELNLYERIEKNNSYYDRYALIQLPKISGIWCAASLLHVPELQIPIVLKNLANLLPSGGPLFFTVRSGDGLNGIALTTKAERARGLYNYFKNQKWKRPFKVPLFKSSISGLRIPPGDDQAVGFP